MSLQKQRRKPQRFALPLSSGQRAVLLAALGNRAALGITRPQLLRLGMLTETINVTDKLKSVLQSTVATNGVSEGWELVLQSIRVTVLTIEFEIALDDPILSH